MNNIKVYLEETTKEPLKVLCEATKLTMIRNFEGFKDELPINSAQIPKKLLDMNHQSPFEHIIMRFFIVNASRTFLAQMTRHRIASYTSGSQHYQNHKNFGFIKPYNLKDNKKYEQYMEIINEYYTYLMDIEGLPKEEARYVLPNACTNNLKITINARSLMNFFNLRLCNRNVYEMRLIACKMRVLAINYFPELFRYALPDCLTSTKCKQGKMICSKGTWENLEN